jgi:hypothetical protein
VTAKGEAFARCRRLNLDDGELAAVRRAIEDDRYPRAPRLDLLRAALGKLEADLEVPQASPALKADKPRR